MMLIRDHYNVSRHVKPTLIARWAKKIRGWLRVKETAPRYHLNCAIAADRAERRREKA
jgi:hypothetical protein